MRLEKTYRNNHGFMPIAISSRTEQYEAIGKPLSITAITLLPLKGSQIDQHLKAAGTGVTALRKVLKDDRELKELAKTPLMLKVRVDAYKGMSAEEIGTIHSIGNRRKHIFEHYIKAMFERKRPPKHFTKERVIRWLAWFAKQIRANSLPIFYIENLQPNWLSRSGERKKIKSWHLLAKYCILVWRLCWLQCYLHGTETTSTSFSSSCDILISLRASSCKIPSFMAAPSFGFRPRYTEHSPPALQSSFHTEP